MTRDILTAIQEREHTFSKGQRRIAAFIRESYDKAAFLTASRLGKAVEVSESTVVRFAMELGYDGYPSMQKAMQEMVMNRLTSVQRLDAADGRIGDDDLVRSVLHSDIEKLRQSAELLDRDSFQKAVQTILGARRIYLIGVRSAAMLANFMGYYLSYMFDNVHVVTVSGGSEMFEKLVSVTAEDAVVAFSFPRYSTATVDGAQYCRRIGATVVGLTNSSMSPLAQHCDHLLLAKSDMLSLVDSLVAPLSVINALLVALAAGRKQILAKNFDTLERVWDEFNVYEKRYETEL